MIVDHPIPFPVMNDIFSMNHSLSPLPRQNIEFAPPLPQTISPRNSPSGSISRKVGLSAVNGFVAPRVSMAYCKSFHPPKAVKSRYGSPPKSLPPIFRSRNTVWPWRGERDNFRYQRMNHQINEVNYTYHQLQVSYGQPFFQFIDSWVSADLH